MQYKAVIEAKADNAKTLSEMLRNEDKSLRKGRGNYTIETKGKKIIFTVNAEDPTALKTLTTAVIKMLEINKKTAGID